MNTKEFITKARKVHGDKYDYSKVNYINSKTKITIICPTHGEFLQIANKHFYSGCRLCAYDLIQKKLSSDNNSFITKARKVHGDKYDYSKVNYINSKTKITIICPTHGEFEQTPTDHLNKHGCKKCAVYCKNSTTQNFISKARKVHGDKYDYSKVNYINSKTKITIICPTHGEFEQTPANHLQKCGCQACAINDINYENLKNDFLKKAFVKHGNKYDYSFVDYKGSHKKVVIICPSHGSFEQTPSNHLYYGCTKCGHELSVKNIKHNNESIIKKFKKVHGDNYDYTEIDYHNYQTNILINCKKHGPFKQRPHNHIKGCGCTQCNRVKTSKGHKEIVNFLKQYENNISINDLKVIDGKELDIYLPNQRIAVEYNGLYFHSYNNINTENKFAHFNKTELCIKNNIKLIHIFENEWNNKQTIVKSILLSKIGHTPNKLYARNCTICKINNKIYKDFVLKNHLQGIANASIKYGLFYDNVLCSVISFKRHKKYEWEIIRFCTKLNYLVIGGFSKLLKHFIKNYHPKSIMTYADRRYSDGGVYINNGFRLTCTTKPGYYYVKGAKLFNRTYFQKHKLHKKLKYFNNKLTEHQNMFANGYRRIWNAGNLKLIFSCI